VSLGVIRLILQFDGPGSSGFTVFLLGGRWCAVPPFFSGLHPPAWTRRRGLQRRCSFVQVVISALNGQFAAGHFAHRRSLDSWKTQVGPRDDASARKRRKAPLAIG
jgi:hypothetical protein